MTELSRSPSSSDAVLDMTERALRLVETYLADEPIDDDDYAWLESHTDIAIATTDALAVAAKADLQGQG